MDRILLKSHRPASDGRFVKQRLPTSVYWNAFPIRMGYQGNVLEGDKIIRVSRSIPSIPQADHSLLDDSGSLHFVPSTG
jgi:hypothetical protein